jgi:hypothetical protein
MGGSALMGGLAANERNNELNARQRRTANAAGDAIQASWARRNGQGEIPNIMYNKESESGNLFAGATGGAMQAYGMEKDGMFGGRLFGEAPQPQAGNLGLNLNSGFNPKQYELPTLFGKFGK